MELWDVFSIINTGWLHHPAFKKMVCVVLVREDLQTALERRARWLFPAGTAVPLVSASPSGTGREFSGLCRGESEPVLEMLEWAP